MSNLQEALEILANDDRATDNERKAAQKALNNIKKRNLHTVEVESNSTLTNIVNLAQVFGCSVVQLRDKKYHIYGHKTAVKAMEVTLDVVGGNSNAQFVIDVANSVYSTLGEVKRIRPSKSKIPVRRVRVPRSSKNQYVDKSVIQMFTEKISDRISNG